MKKIALNSDNFFKLINQCKDLQFKDIEIDNLRYNPRFMSNIIKVTDEAIQSDGYFINSNAILPEKITLRATLYQINKVDFSNTFIEVDTENANIKLHECIIDLSKLRFKKFEEVGFQFNNCYFINDLEDIPNIQVSAKVSNDFWFIPLEMLPPKFTYFLVLKRHLDEILELKMGKTKKSQLLAQKLGYDQSPVYNTTSLMYEWALKLKDIYDR